MKSAKQKRKSADVSLLSGFGGSSAGSSPLPRAVSFSILIKLVLYVKLTCVKASIFTQSILFIL